MDIEAIKAKLATPGKAEKSAKESPISPFKKPEIKPIFPKNPVPEPPKAAAKPTPPEFIEAAKILKEHGGLESNIPINSPYWTLRP